MTAEDDVHEWARLVTGVWSSNLLNAIMNYFSMYCMSSASPWFLIHEAFKGV